MEKAIEEDCGRIEDEPFIGMWPDREDLANSTEWVRELRRKEWDESLSNSRRQDTSRASRDELP